MPDVVKHAWTHRPRAQGGTDPIEITTLLPFAFSQFSGNSLDDGIDFSLGVYESEFEPATYGGTEGIADTIEIKNDGGGSVFRLSDDNTMLWAAGGPGLFAYDIGCYFSTGFTGNVVLYPFLLHPGLLRYHSPAQNIMEENLYPVSTNGSFTIRISGTIYLDMPNYGDNDTNANLMLTARVAQDSGAARTVTQGWMLWTRLSPVST